MILRRLIQFFLLLALQFSYANEILWPPALDQYLKTNSRGQIIVTLSTVCPCSQSHMQHLVALANEFPQYHFIGLHTDSYATTKEYKDFVLQYKESALHFHDDQNLAIARDLQAITTPHVYLFNEQKKLLYHGALTQSHTFAAKKQSYLKDNLTVLSGGKKISITHRHPLGCAISY